MGFDQEIRAMIWILLKWIINFYLGGKKCTTLQTCAVFKVT